MSDILTSIQAAIAEDDLLARSASYGVDLRPQSAGTWPADKPQPKIEPARWVTDYERLMRYGVGQIAEFTDNARHNGCAAAAHAARHDPARVLRQVEATRRILALHYQILRDVGWLEDDDGERVERVVELPVCGLCVPRHSYYESRDAIPLWPCDTLRALAHGHGIEVE